MEITTNQEKSSWNLSQMLIAEIGELLKNSSAAFVSGNYSRVFETLKAVSMRIVSYLNDGEYATLLELEKTLVLCSNCSKIQVGFTKPEIAKIAKNLLIKNLNEYNRLIFSYLKKYGLLIPPKVDKTELRA